MTENSLFDIGCSNSGDFAPMDIALQAMHILSNLVLYLVISHILKRLILSSFSSFNLKDA